eukprot:4351946-Alexandrium_andersonii.AAC.1
MPEKWERRTPCPSCGSRWHRDCRRRDAAVKKAHFIRTLSTFYAERWLGLEMPDDENTGLCLQTDDARDGNRYGIV